MTGYVGARWPTAVRFRDRIDAATEALFAQGWAFMLPYEGLYVLGLSVDTTHSRLRTSFWACHVVMAALLLWFIGRRLSRTPGSHAFWTREGFWFWALLAAVFVLPGAYLEFPGDPWEHWTRINLYRPDAPLRADRYLLKSFYFWGWSLLSLVGPRAQRLVLHFYSALWQMLLAVQLYLFSRRLGFSNSWSRVQVLGVLCLWGNDVFSFFRYYAISSTPAAYIAYLRAGIATLDLLDGRARRRSAVVLVLCLFVMGLNHFQELLLTTVFVLTVAAVRLSATLRPRQIAAVAGLAGAFWLASFAVARTVLRNPEAHGLAMTGFMGFFPYLSEWGTARIWDTRISFFRTLGAHGLFDIAAAVGLLRVRPLVGALVLVPVGLLLFPPFMIAFSQVMWVDASYRILFTLPDTFALVSVAQALSQPTVAGRAGGGEGHWRAGTVLLLVVLGMWFAPPVFGKLRFQLYPVPGSLAVEWIDETADWFARYRPGDTSCVVKSDAVTESSLGALLGRRQGAERVSGLHWMDGNWAQWSVGEPKDLALLQKKVDACGYLVLTPGVHAGTHRSWVGTRSHHWPPDAADPAARLPWGLREAAEGLLAFGWTKTFVPPFYWYYEPPRARGTSTAPVVENGSLLSPAHQVGGEQRACTPERADGDEEPADGPCSSLVGGRYCRLSPNDLPGHHGWSTCK